MPLRQALAATLAGVVLDAATQALDALGLSSEEAAVGTEAPMEVLVMVGITGDATGNISLAFAREGALSLVGLLMNDTAPEHLDDLACSGLGEVGNIVAGHVATQLNLQGLAADIGVPMVIHGEHLSLQVPRRPWYSRLVQTAVGPVALGVGLAQPEPVAT